jgi:glutamate synthase domain-containing protein 3
MQQLDLKTQGLRLINSTLQNATPDAESGDWTVSNPMGQHAIACGLNKELNVTVDGNVGFYCAGMNQKADVTIKGHAGVGVAENMMSGTVRVTGNASQAAGATAHGGLLIIEGDASSRCGISMKGVDIVVGGSVGHMSGFMAQVGHMVICGDAGEALGDSIYEAILYVAGNVESLGADCIEKPMTPEHEETLKELLTRAGIDKDIKSFRRYGSARKLYNFNVDHADEY